MKLGLSKRVILRHKVCVFLTEGVGVEEVDVTLSRVYFFECSLFGKGLQVFLDVIDTQVATCKLIARLDASPVLLLSFFVDHFLAA